MAMIACKECGKKVSDMAKSCTDCGFPVSDYVAYERATNEASALANAVMEVAIQPDKSGGKVLIAGTYEDLEIVVKSRLNSVELIINGMVCAVSGGTLVAIKSPKLETTIRGTHIKAVISSMTGGSKLFIDGNLITRGERKWI